MAAASTQKITQLLQAWGGGDKAALEELTRLCYQELRRIALQHMRREESGHTLQASALVNEAFLRLADWKNVEWQGRAHFFAVAARVMRNILVDLARERAAAKRGGNPLMVSLAAAARVPKERSADIVALDEALDALAALSPRWSKVVELKFFGGLTNEEAAEVLKVHPDTVGRDWRLARAWLYRELSRRESG
ncbi:MAG TPA: sigma-70 family RNA polymerase sigma factor [Pyrinomonadaceae bacterium]|nr:sigma-70 family RNA polymerase sigma factor [Pyrinomonadaceae bacterium]